MVETRKPDWQQLSKKQKIKRLLLALLLILSLFNPIMVAIMLFVVLLPLSGTGFDDPVTISHSIFALVFATLYMFILSYGIFKLFCFKSKKIYLIPTITILCGCSLVLALQ